MQQLERSTSTSRQFIVYGTDPALRGALCAAAERAKFCLLALLQQADDWKTPIVVNAQYPQANLPEIPPATLNFSQTGFGLKLQLDLIIAGDANAPAIEHELLRVTLIEMMYRNHSNLPVGAPYVYPPEWLLDGVLATSRPPEFRQFGDLLKGLAAADKLMSLEEFILQQPELLDSPSRAVYRAYSFALVTWLTDSPNGRNLLAKFIGDLHQASNDGPADLRAHFPVLGTSWKSAEKMWMSNLIRVACAEASYLLTIAETERRLEELLCLRFPVAPQTGEFWNLENFDAFMRFPTRTAVLNQLTQNLMALGTRANPLYRPLILGYQGVTASLGRGRTRGISGRLARLTNSRQTLAKQTQQIDDYMNWFEATQSRSRSGTFAEYLKAANKPETDVRRRDPISVYLDALEGQFHN